jgi:hypothetical protein
MPAFIVAERGEEEAAARQLHELPRRHGPSSAGLLPGLECVHDLAGVRHPLHAGELDGLDMTDHCDAHGAAVSHLAATSRPRHLILYRRRADPNAEPPRRTGGRDSLVSATKESVRRQAFLPLESDIPAGMTIAEYRSARTRDAGLSRQPRRLRRGRRRGSAAS